jgi:hypothetical protein
MSQRQNAERTTSTKPRGSKRAAKAPKNASSTPKERKRAERDYWAETKYDRTKGLRLLDAVVAMSFAVEGHTRQTVAYVAMYSAGGEKRVYHLPEWIEAWQRETHARNVNNANRRNRRIPQPPNVYGFQEIDGIWVAYGLPGQSDAGLRCYACDSEGNGRTLPHERVTEVVSAQRAARKKEEQRFRAEQQREREAQAQMLETMFAVAALEANGAM